MKTVVITGAGAGIGKALTAEFLRTDYRVYACTRSGTLDVTAHPNLTVLELELTAEQSIQQVKNYFSSNKIKLDLIINNAGIGPDINTLVPERKSFISTFETNVFGTVFFTEALLEFTGQGSVIFIISSLMGQMDRFAVADSNAYRMSKTAINMYTKSLSARLKNEQIQVNAIHPGWVKTKMGGTEAPLLPETSAKNIVALAQRHLPSGTFWDAENLRQMNW